MKKLPNIYIITDGKSDYGFISESQFARMKRKGRLEQNSSGNYMVWSDIENCYLHLEKREHLNYFEPSESL